MNQLIGYYFDSSQKRFKLYFYFYWVFYDNLKTPIPNANGVNKKESYDPIECTLDIMKYEENKWRACCDLKEVGFLSGILSGYVKYPCKQYDIKNCETRAHGKLGKHYIIHPSLAPT